MKSEIYYFSGTGNSLFVARQLAKEIDAKVTPIPSIFGKDNLDIESDVLGIIFPCYYASLGESGIPFIVQEFVRKLKNARRKYIFAVCTHGGFPSSTIDNLSRLLKSQGASLSAGFDVRMSPSYSAFDKINYAFFHKPLPEMSYSEKELQATIYQKCGEKLSKIGELVSD
jgi:flavodoxin